MKWYHYLMCFIGGAFLANFVPHFVSGITGMPFPTPLAPPPLGKSPPVVNVIWGLINLAVAYVLLRYGRFTFLNWTAVITAFIGGALMSIMLANTFGAIPH
jgi:choline-glycine betaine transporter